MSKMIWGRQETPVVQQNSPGSTAGHMSVLLCELDFYHWPIPSESEGIEQLKLIDPMSAFF